MPTYCSCSVWFLVDSAAVPLLLQPQYLGLEELCQEFAVELLGMCRNQSEVTTILNSCGDESQDSLEEQAFEEGIPNLSRLRLAVNFNQKQVAGCRNDCRVKTDINLMDHLCFLPRVCRVQFVAHPICQQVLSSIWCGNLSGWRGSKTTWKLFVSVGIFFTMPFLCLVYWIAPKSKVTSNESVLHVERGHERHSIQKIGGTHLCLGADRSSSFVFLPAGEDTQDSCDQVPPPLCLLSVVSHHVTGRIDNDGDISRQICFPHAGHPAQLLPHGVGGRWVPPLSCLTPLHIVQIENSSVIPYCAVKDSSGTSVRRCGWRGCGATSWTGGTAWM